MLSRTIRRPARATTVAVAVVAAAYLAAALTHLGGLRWNFDEGLTVQKAWLVRDGYPLFTAVWTDHMPGHVIAVAAAFRVFGVSLATARAVTVAFGLVALVAAAVGAWALLAAGRARPGALLLGTTASAAILAVAPNFWWASRAAMLGIPAFSLGALAMALLLVYAGTGRRAALAGSALALGLSLAFKLQMAYLGPVAGVVVLVTRWGRPRELLADLVVLGVGSLGPAAACFVLFDPRAVWAEAVGTYLATRSSYAPALEDNLATFRTWLLSDNAGLAALAAAGLVLSLARSPRVAWVAAAWAALTIVTALQHAPLFIEDHFEPLLLALVVLAGAGVGWGVDGLLALQARGGDEADSPGSGDGRACAAARPQDEGAAPSAPSRVDTASPAEAPRHGGTDVASPRSAGAAVLVAALGLGAYLLALPHVLAIDRSVTTARGYGNDGVVVRPGSAAAEEEAAEEAEMRRAIAFLAAHSGPDDFVITDDPILAFLAQRRVPPELAALSSRRIAIGAMSGGELRRVTAAYRPPVVLTWKSSLRHYESYIEWLGRYYHVAETFDDPDHQGWLLNAGAAPAVEPPRD